MMMEHFTMEEMTRSATAERLGIDNTPTEEEKRRIEGLVENVLDPLRRAWGGPIKVNSGYRSAGLNAAVGGAKRSQHMLGEAADITVGSKEANRRLWQKAIEMDLPYDQIIDERGYSWIHISYTEGATRHQILHIR